MNETRVTTIGFTKSTAERFFERILSAGVKTVVDVRLHNTSQLAGFAKAEDLSFFLRKIGNINYIHKPILAPTDDILKSFKKEKGDWKIYEESFMNLMNDRKIENRFDPDFFNESCLLCSEDTAHYCHRRLVVEYLNDKWGHNLQVRHL
ncbi:DUF488 family protein [Sphingopyxis witflariensis]|uniref:DUF488 domain-containing protein n=1 Tax=Sphingopyxis witflariensis TaxID=173675 RepID=A0A246JGP1_9SPHN|nr:DUF488 domain-containing protein [Sphingopyxis witflariensis]OWQ91772.1 hypothetical protein CDQ91_18755 [Sphingopyxis witflariensis]